MEPARTAPGREAASAITLTQPPIDDSRSHSLPLSNFREFSMTRDLQIAGPDGVNSTAFRGRRRLPAVASPMQRLG